MGFFDSLSATFSWIDGIISFIPATARLLLWSALCAFVSMWLYRLTSNQKRISELKSQLKGAQKALADYDGDDFSGLIPLMKQSLGLSFRRLGRTLGPALLASVPLIFVLAWASNQFGNHLPQPGEEVAVTIVPVTPQAPAAQLQWRDVITRASGKGELSLLWPESHSNAGVQLGGAELLKLPLPHPSSVVHQKKWWNSLIGNPAGYLPAQPAVEAIYFDLEQQEFLPFGPDWMRGWLCLFFVGVLVFSLVVKAALRIH